MGKKLLLALAAFSMLIQSCQVYYKKPSTLDQAAAKSSRVKLTRINGEKVKLIRIEKTDSTYYAVKRIHGKLARFPLNKNDISNVRLINKTGSTLATIGVSIIGVAILIPTLFPDWFRWKDTTLNLEPM